MQTIFKFKILIILILLLGNTMPGYAQQYSREQVCSPDTVLIRRDRIHMIKSVNDTTSYKALQCSLVSE